jgi:hypothetical protein
MTSTKGKVKGGEEQVLIRVTAGHAEDHAAHADAHLGADLQQFQSDALAGSAGHGCAA